MHTKKTCNKHTCSLQITNLYFFIIKKFSIFLLSPCELGDCYVGLYSEIWQSDSWGLALMWEDPILSHFTDRLNHTVSWPECSCGVLIGGLVNERNSQQKLIIVFLFLSFKGIVQLPEKVFTISPKPWLWNGPAVEWGSTVLPL